MHSRTTPYHHQRNGLVECMNCTLLGMLRTLPESRKSRWKDHLNKLIHAYNCTVHESTNYSPFYLLFGQSPRLPIGLIIDIKVQPNTKNDNQNGTRTDYVSKSKTAMQEAYKLAHQATAKSVERRKRRYNRQVCCSALELGDCVLVRNLTPRKGQGKLRAFWEEEIHLVITQKGPDSPVYEVKPESSRGGHRTLHRNLLLSCNYRQLARF